MCASYLEDPLVEPAPATGERLVSVDALRGFDLFWIVGGSALAAGLEPLSGVRFVGVLNAQLKHADWEGFTFYDLIFPLFVFVTGVSVVFSLGKLLDTHGRAAAYRRMLPRALWLFLLGIFFYGGVSDGFSQVRVLGVLQRIALCYLLAGLLFVHVDPWGRAAICVSVLAGYWLLLCYVPAPGLDHASLAEGHNWPNYIDARFLPGRLNNKTWDPEGILSTLPAVVTALLGVFAGECLTHRGFRDRDRLQYLLGGGILLLVAGYLWGIPFPVIKKLWTSSYVLVAGGYSLLILALFYLVVDVWKLRAWCAPFVWLGSNALAIYLAANIVDFQDLAQRLAGGEIAAAAGPAGALLVAVVRLGLVFYLANWLYRRRIFLRV